MVQVLGGGIVCECQISYFCCWYWYTWKYKCDKHLLIYQYRQLVPNCMESSQRTNPLLIEVRKKIDHQKPSLNFRNLVEKLAIFSLKVGSTSTVVEFHWNYQLLLYYKWAYFKDFYGFMFNKIMFNFQFTYIMMKKS